MAHWGSSKSRGDFLGLVVDDQVGVAGEDTVAALAGADDVFGPQ